MATGKPQLPALKTPVSATYPSEIASPMACTPTYIKQEDLKTPITPPAAYVDFLKAFSPTLMTPTTGDRSSFPDDKLPAKVPSASQPPPTNRTMSSTSTASIASTASDKSNCSCSCDNHKSPHVATPRSPFAHPLSARSPRRLRIPQSPYSPATRSPLSAASITSTYSAMSPRDWEQGKAGMSSSMRAVSVRQVVTRTVTYSRTPLDPAPKGKRRKIEE